jgi:hypothetical protein
MTKIACLISCSLFVFLIVIGLPLEILAQQPLMNKLSAYKKLVDSHQFEKVHLHVYFSESIHPVSFQTVQPDQGFFFLATFHLASINAA